MYDAFPVRRFQPFAEMARQGDDPVLRQWACGAGNELLQVLAVDPRHGNETKTVRFAEVVDAQHVPVRDAAGQQDLLLQLFQTVGVFRQLGPYYFERHAAVQIQVGGPVHAAHTAFAGQLFDAIARTEHAASGKDAPCGGRSRSNGSARLTVVEILENVCNRLVTRRRIRLEAAPYDIG